MAIQKALTQSVLPGFWKLVQSPWLKPLVYGLLLLNSVLYFLDEWRNAQLLLSAESSWLQWSGLFKTTIDEIGWLGLILAFEIETFWLSARSSAFFVLRSLLRSFRWLCYLLLAHTVMVNVTAGYHYLNVTPEVDAPSPCSLVEANVFYTHNLSYTLIESDNCLSFEGRDLKYYLEPNVISDEAGYQLAGWHAWFDFQDALLWLLVVAVIELSVWRRHKGRSLGRMPLVAGLIYGALLIDGGFWMINGHYLYMYDQLLWIFGFWAIEANLRSKQSSEPLMQS